MGIVSSGELSSQLVTSELGVFSLLFSSEHITTLLPTFTISTCETLTNSLGETETTIKDVIIQPLEEDYRLETLQLSITAVKEQATLYASESFHAFITEVIEECDFHKVTHGSTLMKNELNIKVHPITTRLEQALNRGAEEFYLEFINLMRELDDKDNSRLFVNGQPGQEKFLKVAVAQHGGTPTLLKANWFEAILEALWYGGIGHKAYKIPVLHKNVPEMMLELSTARLPEERPNTTHYDINERLWVDLGLSSAGLSPEVVNAILRQHDQARLIDILKLFTTIYYNSLDVQRTHQYQIANRWVGLIEMLHERYGVSKKHRGAVTEVQHACRLLESLRWGTGYENHIKLLSFDGLEKHQDLTVTYLGGFRKSIEKSERLVPILNHPKGKTRSSALYNRFGLALGIWFVKNSDVYLTSKIGVPLDDRAKRYFMQAAGFGRIDRVNKAIDAFEEDGALIRQNGLLGLGEVNEEGKKLILWGAQLSRNGAKGGQKSRKKQNK